VGIISRHYSGIFSARLLKVENVQNWYIFLLLKTGVGGDAVPATTTNLPPKPFSYLPTLPLTLSNGNLLTVLFHL